MSPQRIQRCRTAGWRMPDGAVYVGRPTEFGNPFRVERCNDPADGWKVVGNGEVSLSADDDHPWTRAQAAEFATARFERSVSPRSVRGQLWRIRLAGKDLACWCPLDRPCHADVLLRLANGDPS